MFIFERERKIDRTQVGEGQGEGDTESEAGSRLWAWTPDPWDHDLSQSRTLKDWATQVPQEVFFLKTVCIAWWDYEYIFLLFFWFHKCYILVGGGGEVILFLPHFA